MIEFTTQFYDIVVSASLGLILFPLGLSQIRLEKPSFGMIGYTFHRVYTSIGFLQLCNTIRLLDYNNETIRIITQWFTDLQSMMIIIAILILNAYIQILSKNVLSNSMSTHWYQLDTLSRFVHSALILLTVICSNLPTALRIVYRYELWTVLILLSNATCLLYTTCSLHYYLHHFFKHTQIVVSHLNMSSIHLIKTLNNMYLLRVLYTMMMAPVFYFLGYYATMLLTTDSYHLNEFNTGISYLRYIILFGCFVMAWIAYLRPEQPRVSPVIRPRKTSDVNRGSTLHEVFVLS
jgi:hypothetical protein